MRREKVKFEEDTLSCKSRVSWLPRLPLVLVFLLLVDAVRSAASEVQTHDVCEGEQTS